MSSILSAYIDESGSTNLLDREGENRFYVSTAIVVNTSDINLLIKRLDDISASFNIIRNLALSGISDAA